MPLTMRALAVLIFLVAGGPSHAVDWKVTRTAVTTTNNCHTCCYYQYRLCLKGDYQVMSDRTKVVKKTYYEDIKVGTRTVRFIDHYVKRWNQQTCRYDREPVYGTRTEGVYEERTYTKNVTVNVLETVKAHCFELEKMTNGHYSYEFQGHWVPYGKNGSYFRSDTARWDEDGSMWADWGDSRHDVNALPLGRAIEDVIRNFGSRR